MSIDPSRAGTRLAEPTAARRRRVNPVPFEGENGLFFQTWYPICLSTEVAPGQVVGREFLDGKVVVVRGESGAVRVQSAYCPHLGADLSVGKVRGDSVQCAFHHWEYDAAGVCVRTGIGDPAPRSACLFSFPTVEKYGIVWAFNGEEPLWELPSFEHPEHELVTRSLVTGDYRCDGWIFACNTPDMQHIKVVHGIKFKTEDPHELVEWRKDGFDYEIEAAHQGGIALRWRVGIRGTSFFWQRGTYDGWWLGALTGFSCPRPGRHQVFLTLAVHKGEGSLQAKELAEKRLDIAEALLSRTVGEDRDILDTIHYAPGALTRGDTSLARYLDFLRNYPRAHPSADFIR
jgi:phenylpropionate dioxygenase-like ring-hydroxylating dioxygenase large terminal subunit